MSLFEQIDNPGKEQGKKAYIEDLQVGQRVESYYRLVSVSKRAKKDGNAFLIMELMDKTGKLPAKSWDNAEKYLKVLKPGDIYRFKGSITEYLGTKELKIDFLRAVSSSDKELDPADFVESAGFDTGEMFADMLRTLRANIKSNHLLQLVELFDQEYGEAFRGHYGAQKVHHAYIGGLLEHTHSMMKLAVYCADHYGLDKELLLAGVLFHDVGKVFEFSVTPALRTTEEGGLLGHLIIGNTIFLKLKDRVADFPGDLALKIQHLIISHHGEKEFGSPEVPKMPEAYVLHVLDLLDSKLKIMEENTAAPADGGHFTEYVKFLDRRLYVPSK